jgi:hypothetical protein
MTWVFAAQGRCGVSVSDRESPLITVRSGTPRARRSLAYLAACVPRRKPAGGGNDDALTPSVLPIGAHRAGQDRQKASSFSGSTNRSNVVIAVI